MYSDGLVYMIGSQMSGQLVELLKELIAKNKSTTPSMSGED
jgi:hypothetical protein